MSRWYVDTSAALKLLVHERESGALGSLLDRELPDLVACSLLETEMRRVAQRENSLTHAHVSAFLQGVDLHEMPPALFREAGRLPGPHLRSLDALHIAAAIRLDVEHLLTYDARMAESAHALGVPVLAPR